MNSDKKNMLTVGLVIPVYMESEIVGSFHSQLIETINNLPYHFTIIYIDDGSTDGTADIIKSLALKDKRIMVVELSRNFGHQSALTAGLNLAQGDVVITIDGDGQHPVSMIQEMIALYFSGYDVIQTQHEMGRSGRFKELTSKAFYWLIGKISDTKIRPGTSDFRLLSRRALDALKLMPEYHRFLRGLIPWMGFPTVILPYTPLDRIGGSTKYTLKKMTNLAADAVFSFSTTPIKISIAFSAIFLILAIAETSYAFIFWLTGNINHLVPGWTSLMFVSLIGNALVLFNIGVIGIYVGYVFQQVKERPIYIIKSIFKYGNKGKRE
jgi:glycosyltransferase involved in cell wall biosynthesis